MTKQVVGQIVPASPAPGSVFRLVVIPLLIYGAWVLDTFLLEGSIQVFARYQPFALILYTIVANILIGIIVPVACLQPAFLSGAVNLFQAGFRSLRRTAISVMVTALAGYLLLVTFTPFSSQRAFLPVVFALMLPAAIACVMVIWVLAGTHLQAYVRQKGAVVSILAGVISTGFFFTGTFAGHDLQPEWPAGFLLLFVAGAAAAVFFFSVRDIWASAVFLSYTLAVILQGQVDPVYLGSGALPVAACAAASVVMLAASQQYLSRYFITVRAPAGISGNEES